MRRIAALVAGLALAAGLGTIAPASASPDATAVVGHTPWPSFEYDTCTWWKNARGYGSFYVDTDDSTWGHGFDGHHIVWCAIRQIGSSSGANSVCFYGDYNTNWVSGFFVRPNNGCWDTGSP